MTHAPEDEGTRPEVRQCANESLYVQFDQDLRHYLRETCDKNASRPYVLEVLLTALGLYEDLVAERRRSLALPGSVYSSKPFVPSDCACSSHGTIESTEIRLLVFDKVESGKPLRCSVRVWDVEISCLHDAGGHQLFRDLYSALSYRWTRGSTSSTLIVDDHETAISEDLDAAIRSVSTACTSAKGSGQFILWIDSICINQSDIRERSQQVAIMSFIYRHCRICFVWLGQGASDVEHLVDWIREFERTVRNQPDDKSMNHSLFEIKMGQERRDAVTHFLSRSYWERLWIVQEVLLSRQKVIIYGRKQIGWENLYFFLKYLSNCAHPNLAYTIQTSVRTVMDLVGMDRHFESLDRRPSLSFLEGLIVSQGRKVSDPRDAVIAIISLVKSTGFTPNYSKNAGDIWIQAVCKILEEDQSLNVLSMADNIDPMRRSTDGGPKRSFMKKLLLNRGKPFGEVLDIEQLKLLGYDVARLTDDYKLLISMKLSKQQFSKGLFMSWCNSSIHDVSELPTWVADWSDSRPLDTHILYTIDEGKMRKRAFRAAPFDTAKLPKPSRHVFIEMLPKQFLASVARFGTHAFFVGTVEAVQISRKGGDIVDIWSEWNQHLASMEAPPYDSLASKVDAFVDTLWLREFFRHEPPDDLRRFQRDELRRALLQVIEFFPSICCTGGCQERAAPQSLVFTGCAGDNTANSLIMSQGINSMLERIHTHFSVFFTTDGRIGLGGKGVRPGDSVYIVPGCDVPLILRNCSNSQTWSTEPIPTELAQNDVSGPRCDHTLDLFLQVGPVDLEEEVDHRDHWLISECYVGGIMHGEFVILNQDWNKHKRFVRLV